MTADAPSGGKESNDPIVAMSFLFMLITVTFRLLSTSSALMLIQNDPRIAPDEYYYSERGLILVTVYLRCSGKLVTRITFFIGDTGVLVFAN